VVPWPQRPNAPDRFLLHAKRSPEQVAVVDGSTEWTYGQLAAEAAKLARGLARMGIGPDSLVGLCVPRGWRVVAGILGIWMHGCAYLPIDPAYPSHRRSFIADDSQVSHIVVGADTSLAVEAVNEAASGHVLPDGTAYVIYTSGSTGTPKGVLVRHDNLSALLDGAVAELPVRPDDVGTVFHSYCFDMSVWEIWRVLTTGGRCIFVPTEVTLHADRFIRLLADMRISLLSLVPSVFANLVRALQTRPVPLPHLRELIFGGEALNVNAVQAWYQLGLAPDARLVNMYGITETTVHVTSKALSSEQLAACRGPGTPIGAPLPHLRVAILDERGRPVSSGAVGEMHVAGAGVSAGYLNRPELTDERFVRLDFDDRQSRWYRTGDFARRDSSGELMFIGRRDDQIQLHGHRIELGEIDAAIQLLPDVAAGATVVVPNLRGEPVLVACYIPASNAKHDGPRIRAGLRSRLPRYMIPAMLVPVIELPVTPEGKLDRAALSRHVRQSADHAQGGRHDRALGC
jgi:D-alanine--poly(phosphoribitol) ligase subunit 1